MQFSKRSILLLLLLSWLSILASARAIRSTRQGQYGDYWPAQLQRSSLVAKSEVGRLSNTAHLFGKAGVLSIVPPTFKHETLVDFEKRKSPGSSSSNSPNTSSGSPDSTSSSDTSDDPNTGAGLDLNSPNTSDPAATPEDPGAGLNPFATVQSPDPSPATADPTPATPNPTPATANPTVTSPDSTATGSADSSVSNIGTSLIASASDPVPTETAASPPAAATPDSSGEPSGGDNTPTSPSPEVITIEEAEARFCSSNPGSLRLRGLCSSSEAGDDGSDSESPARAVQDPNPLPPNVAPAVDRTTVNDWYDVIQQNPKPLFRAKDALDARIRGTGQDKPVADFTGKYSTDVTNMKDIFIENDMKSTSSMWQKLGRTTPGEGQKIFILPETNAEDFIHQANFAKDGSFIGAIESNRNRDPLANSPDRIEWSELMFNQLHGISGGNPSALNAVGRASIANKATDSTIKTALTRTGRTTTSPEEVVTFRADAAEGSEEALAFEAISRSDNVNGVLFLLADHYDAIGRKTVTALNVARTSSGGAFSLVIDIA